MSNKLAFFACLFSLSAVAQSPITLGNSNMPGNNDTLRYTNVVPGSVGNYTQTGTNHNWNFSNVTSLNEGVRSFKSAFLTPYAFFFLGLNEYGEKLADSLPLGIVVLTDYYNFYKKQNNPNAFTADGVGLSYQNIPIPAYYSDKDEIYNFPMTYPKYDSTTFRFSVATPSLPVKYNRTGTRVTKVDGWGTITTPYGTANCLRLVSTVKAVDSLKLTLFPLAFPSVQRSYQWLTTSSKIPYFEVTGNVVAGNFVPTQVRYRGYDKAGPVGVSETELVRAEIYPNPCRDHLMTGHVECHVNIFDLEGRLVLAAPTDKNGKIDVSKIAPGSYILQVPGESRQGLARFLKE